jgi:hypothetical protein
VGVTWWWPRRLLGLAEIDAGIQKQSGGALCSGGVISGVTGQGGPELGIYLRNWGLGFLAQAGYGNAGGFGQLSIVKQWSFTE